MQNRGASGPTPTPSAGTYQIRAGLVDNGTTWTYTNWYPLNPAAIQNGWSAVEVSYRALFGDGAAGLWLNGTLQQSLGQIGNSTRTLTEVRLGAQNVVTTTRGTLYFDNFESRRFSYIGTLPPPDLPQPQLPNNPGWTATNYTYSTAHPHAATAADSNSYSYDANGNMTCRMESGGWFVQSYNAENRLSSVTQLASVLQMWNGTCPSPATFAAKWDFAYDGDGTRVSQLYTPYDSNGNPQTPVLTVYFMGGAYEVTGSAVKKYYAIAGMTVAMNDGSGLKYLLTDHLGSIVAITDGSGTLISQQRYLPFGQVRTDVGPSVTQTDFAFTGQRNIASMGLMDYHARMYDAYLNRFISPDTIIPNPANPQAFNRYNYVLGRPIVLSDPSGYAYCDFINSQNKEDCKGGQWRISSSPSGLNLKGYSNFEKEAIENLYYNGGPNARHGVNYILANGVHFMIGTGWQSFGGTRGAWFLEGSKTLVINSETLGNFDSNGQLNAWGLSLIIHEALHLEQGPELSHSKLGEGYAWQIQFDVRQHLGDTLSTADRNIMNAKMLERFTTLIRQNYPDYWKKNGVGLYTYPDFPSCDYGWTPCIKKPWWANLNPPNSMELLPQIPYDGLPSQ